jgi:hypothetical protein
LAKRGTFDHPKTIRLARALDVETWAALGLLEALWHWTAKYAPDGHIETENWPALAEQIRFSRGSEQLRQVLIQCGWIDESKGETFVHDWPDHADDAAKKALTRAGTSFHCHYKRPTVSGRRRDNVGTVSRLPEPVPEPEPEPVPVAPAAAPRYDADGQVLVQETAAALHQAHSVAGFDPGQAHATRFWLGKRLASAVHPQAVVSAILASHRAWCVFWTTRRREWDAGGRMGKPPFVPLVAKWLEAEQDLSPPRIAAESPKNGPKVFDLKEL